MLRHVATRCNDKQSYRAVIKRQLVKNVIIFYFPPETELIQATSITQMHIHRLLIEIVMDHYETYLDLT